MENIYFTHKIGLKCRTCEKQYSGAAAPLLHMEDPTTAGTGVIGILKVTDKEWNQTAAKQQPARQK